MKGTSTRLFDQTDLDLLYNKRDLQVDRTTLHLLVLIHNPPPLKLLDNLLPIGRESVAVPLEQSRTKEGRGFVDLQLLGLKGEEE